MYHLKAEANPSEIPLSSSSNCRAFWVKLGIGNEENVNDLLPEPYQSYAPSLTLDIANAQGRRWLLKRMCLLSEVIHSVSFDIFTLI